MKTYRRPPRFYFRRCKRHESTRKIMVAHTRTEHSRRKYVTVEVDGHHAHLQLDAACDIPLISQRTWQPRTRFAESTPIAHICSGVRTNEPAEKDLRNVFSEEHSQQTAEQTVQRYLIYLSTKVYVHRMFHCYT